jgi:TolB-like protein
VLLKSAELPFGGDICRIAVLPLTNQTEHPTIERIFGRVFISELISAGNYQVAHEGDIRQILTQMRMLSGLELSSEQIRGLADRLGVQIVISGAVLEVESTGDNVLDINPSMAVVLRILEASSGRTIWATYNRSEGSDYRIVMHFGLINTVSALAKKVSAEIIDEWAKEGFKKCTE